MASKKPSTMDWTPLTTEEVETAVVVAPAETATVKLLHGVHVQRDTEKYFVVVTTEGSLKGYLVKPTAVENTNQPQTIIVSDALELYDFSGELAIMFPDVETVRRNALLSFWKAGALFETDKANEKIVATMFDSAYPYRMP